MHSDNAVQAKLRKRKCWDADQVTISALKTKFWLTKFSSEFSLVALTAKTQDVQLLESSAHVHAGPSGADVASVDHIRSRMGNRMAVRHLR